MTPDPADLAEAELAAGDPATLYADLLEDWNELFIQLTSASQRLLDISSRLDPAQSGLISHLRGQAEGLQTALAVMREYRPAPESIPNGG